MAKKISVIIPNYNGLDLLAKNLPSVIKNCPGCEIIVVDDKSTDDSVKLLKEDFKNIRIIENKKNEGFAKTVNEGATEARGDLLLLLNTDVTIKHQFLENIIKYFEKDKTDKLFAVGLCDISHENDKSVKRGRGSAHFRKGFLSHFAAKVKSGPTLWVSGGSGIFDRQKFLMLGGFDPIFAPFYWEDIDLSYRAWKTGFFCFFDPDSQVDHYHEEGIIKKYKSEFYVKTVSYKNQFIFVWKNISDYQMVIQHLLWLPYHVLRALVNFDLPFFAGLFWAVLKIPYMIFNYEQPTINYQISDREVLKKFEGQ